MLKKYVRGLRMQCGSRLSVLQCGKTPAAKRPEPGEPAGYVRSTDALQQTDNALQGRHDPQPMVPPRSVSRANFI
jgi:hypothetical protein